MKVPTYKLLLLKERVEAEFGHTPLSPSDFDKLSARIQSRCGESVAVSTLKRLWGYVKNPFSPTFTTLSVLCRYAGYRDWHSFCAQIPAAASVDDESGFTDDRVIVAADEPVGLTLRLEWPGGKCCVIRKTADPSQFEIIEATAIKLRAGDMVNIDMIVVGERFVATHCTRGSQPLGTYHGAIKGGVTTVARVD